MDIQLWNLYIIAFYKVVFLVLGSMGNSLFIHLIYKRKQIQSRTSILQCFQCLFHIFCQIGTVMSGVDDVGTLYRRNDCLNRIAFNIFFQTAQGIIMFIIVIDIILFVKFPIIYRSTSSKKYTLLIITPIMFFSTLTTCIAFLTTDSEYTFSCGPPFAFGESASTYYNLFFILLGIIVMVAYLFLIHTFYVKSHNRTRSLNSLKTVKRLQFSVLIFISTWFFSQILGFIVLRAPAFSEWSGMMFAHTALLVGLCYSNTFYVTMWRSKEYRDQFCSLWWNNRRIPSSVAVLHQTSSHSLK